jgi:thioredoxin-like negative regulator of GroEL
MRISLADCFQAAVKIRPKDADIRRSYAAALAEQGRKEEAVKQLRELLQLKPDTEARSQLTMLFAASIPHLVAARHEVLSGAGMLDAVLARPRR